MERKEKLMELTFTSDEFLAMVEQYNQAIWPTQVVAYILALCVVFLIINKVPQTNRLISGILALFWLWIGLVFQLLYFREIQGGPAIFFGILMILQAILLFVAGVVQNRLHFAAGLEPSKLVGAVFIFYALYYYPVLGSLAGYDYPLTLLFGVAPCPTTIFTFGLLLWTEPRIPRSLLPIPFVWSLFSIDAALSLGMVQDFALPIVALLGTFLIVRRDHLQTPKHGSPQHHTA
jgi:hypothetical protein